MNFLTIICLASVIAGCRQADAPKLPDSENAAPSSEPDRQATENGSSSVPSTSPEGWQMYDSPESGFTVMVPGNPSETSNDIPNVWKVRSYTFQDGETPLVIEIYSDRTGALATNTVEDLRESPDIVPGTLRELSHPGLPGIEFRSKGSVGEVVHREYCSADNSRSISILVQKDVGKGISEHKVQLFLDSFKLLD
jgi:hypothetical protein